MKLEDIQREWTKDSQIDSDELGKEATKTVFLHSKYITWLVEARLGLKKLKYNYEELKKEKWEFYVYGPTPEQIKKGWQFPPVGKILKQDVKMYLDADNDLINLCMKIDFQQEKVSLLESIIETINRRGFQIRAAIDWEKFKNGLN